MEFFILSILILIAFYIGYRWQSQRRKPSLPREKESELNQREEDFHRINSWMITNQKYLDPDIKLDKVARGLQLSEKQVSSAINTIACQNFNSYINKLRIKEAQHLLVSAEYNHYTIDAIAEMVGFSNKVSFYKAFKKVTDQSPTDYRKSAEV